MKTSRTGAWTGIFYLCVLAFSACARYGAAPTGGPKDVAPPVLVRALPAEGNVNVEANEDSRQIVLEFDEYVVLQNTDKIVVSPPHSKVSYRSNLKKVTVLVEDTLRPDITYSINFKNAIGDLHESTPLSNYTYFFSTGSSIDSGRISGMLLDAFTLEPVKEASVMFYARKPETYPVTDGPDYVAVTDTAGLFVAEYMRKGCYYLIAGSDENKNYQVEPTEEKTAFSSDCWQTETYRAPLFFAKRPGMKESDTMARRVFDSLREARSVEEKAAIKGAGHCLYMYQDKERNRFLKEAKWNKKGEIEIAWHYAIEADSLQLMFLPAYQDMEMWRQWEAALADTVAETSGRKRQHRLKEEDLPDIHWPDSLHYVYIAQDNPLAGKVFFNDHRVTDLRLVFHYMGFSDTAELMLSKGAMSKDDTAALGFTSRQRVLFYTDSLVLDFNFPLEKTDLQKALLWRIRIDEDNRRDTVPEDAAALRFELVRPDRMVLRYGWQQGYTYQFIFPSACFTDCFGREADTTIVSVNVALLDSYGQVSFKIGNLEEGESYVLQLCDAGNYVIQSCPVGQSGVAEFNYVTPGNVRFVLIRDQNGNGVWDQGDYEQGVQPERRWIFPKTLRVEADWRIEETWNIAD